MNVTTRTMQGTMGEALRKLKVLLVGPDYRMATGWLTMDARPGVCADLAPVTLAALAGLTPKDVELELWDEPVQGRIDDATLADRAYDFVGVTGYSGHIDHAIRIASVFRRRGTLVGVGGPGVSVHPSAYRDHFDVLFLGEAEETWPRFLADLAAGDWAPEYREVGKPSLDNVPPPNWEALDTGAYAMGQFQTTRGCPFDCDFCDVIYLFGRNMRHKPVAAVADEIRELGRLGFHTAFITDDEFVGDRRYTKELLRAMRDVNHSLDVPVGFATQATINASRDDELLELAADAGMVILFVGIESLNPETLKAINKRQNLNKDLLAEAQHIMSYGIALRANTIVGFDEDDTSTFGELFDFHQTGCFPIPAVTILQAPHGTPLWRRMVEKGQVVEAGAFERGRYADDYSGYSFNTLPKGMTRVELMEGYADIYTRLYEWPNMRERNAGWLQLCERPPRIPEPRFTKGDLVELFDNFERRSLLDDETRRAIVELADLCVEVAPSLWNRLRMLLTMQAHIRRSLHERVVPSLERQIELESSGAVTPVVKQFRPPVPLSFRQHFGSLLGPVYARVERNLDDPEQLYEAITEVFVDFLVRWGDEFDEPEPHHEVLLAEVCDRTCARRNGVAPELFVAQDAAPPSAAVIFQARQDLLRNLDIELGFEPSEGTVVTASATRMSHG